MATIVGMTSQAKIASPMGSPPVTEAKSPVTVSYTHLTLPTILRV